MSNCPECGDSFTALGRHLAFADCCPELTHIQYETLRGVLMGDGWIGTSGRCVQAEWACEEYAKYISNKLGWACGEVKERNNRSEIYQISTVSCDAIEEMVSGWKINSEKRWDISDKLSKIAFANLYACDGSLKMRDGRKSAATIRMDNESDRANEIAEWISKSGFPKPNVQCDGNVLYFTTSDTPKLLSMIKPVSGYEYKWM